MLLANRAKSNWQRAIRSGALPEDVCLTYWDTYAGAMPVLDSPPPRVLRLVDRRVSNPLANKRDFMDLTRRYGLSHTLTPFTTTDVEEMDRRMTYNDVCFVKPMFGTGGKGMYCVTKFELEKPDGEAYVLQLGVQNLRLHQNRKYTARVYAFVYLNHVYLFDRGFIITHGAEYNRISLDRNVQIEHRGYQDYDSLSMNTPTIQVVGDGDLWPWDALQNTIRAFCPRVLSRLIAATDGDTYQLLGIDCLVLQDGSVRVLEMNTYPSFQHTAQVNRRLNVPFLCAVLREMLGQKHASDDGKLVLIY